MHNHRNGTQRWLALFATCSGMLVVGINGPIVSVALPSMSVDLHLAGTSLSWIVNAYVISFGGFLLVAGRLGDLYGRRRVFLGGIIIFALASLGCGLAYTPTMLLVSRAIQGIGAAAVAAIGLSLAIALFQDQAERARAFAIEGFVECGVATAAPLLGGLLIGSLGWHSIFLLIFLICIVPYVFCTIFLPPDAVEQIDPRPLDLAGAVTIILTSILCIYAIVNVSNAGWISLQTSGALGVSGILFLSFLIIEARAPEPLIPVRVFRARNFTTANIISAVVSGGVLNSFVIVALYLQQVLGYDPFHAGIAFAPVTILQAFANRFAATMSVRFGMRTPLSVGLLLCAIALALLVRSPQSAAFSVDVLPPMLLLGLGVGLSTTPLMLAAMEDVESKDSGLASGIYFSSFILSGAYGFAILIAAANGYTGELRQSDTPEIAALNGGYHAALLIGALVTAAAATISPFALHPRSRRETSAASQQQGTADTLTRSLD